MSRAVRPRAARKSAEERAAEIRTGARDVALEGGLWAVTLRSVAARVGVTPALVAHYQPNMEVLVADTFTAVVAAEMAEVAGIVEPYTSPTDRLAALIHTLIETARDDVTTVWLDGWSLGRRSAPLATAVRAQMDAWQHLVLGIVDDGCSTGEFTASDPQTVAWHLLGMVDGLSAQGLVSYRDPAARGRLVTDALEHALGLPSGALTAPAGASATTGCSAARA
ncbi:TetR/AcrR family transcriptional regulator [Leifsonia flava]|uniref:TetR family transcriptional regulator n=1 Tax=Orlajensenia leifsoniae TaxID=2561933 RepID=A0A4Y9QV13_9MICO|nr:TetR family transcriptional regulator C-terminal domain-containing protein [Leifsonia flava]TFV95332.1 TetR family transcriptional regulator [Leifsonia flava]